MPRLVIVEPAYASTVGHHGEVNRPLLAALAEAGWSCELWADVALEGEATAPGPLRGVFSGCGYGDPRQWRELGGPRPEALAGWGWLFHQHSASALPDEEQALLERTSKAGIGLVRLEGEIASAAMGTLLARCPLALLAYNPERYAERSSGMLWQWAAGRAALGLRWRRAEGGQWLAAIAAAAAALPAGPTLSPYGRQVLTETFAAWATRILSNTTPNP